jgi:anti-anti-sigma factor
MKSSSYYYPKLPAQEAVDQVEGVEGIANLLQVLEPPQWEIATGDASRVGYLHPDSRRAAARQPRKAPGHPTVVRLVPIVGDQRDIIESRRSVLDQAGYVVRGTWTEPKALALPAEFQPDAAVGLDLSRSSSAIAWQLWQVPGLEGKAASGTTSGAQLLAESDVVVVRLPEGKYGSLDDAKLTRTRQLFLGLASQPGSLHLIVDLSGVQHIGASFIGIMVTAWGEVKKRGRRLVLCGLNRYCTRLFHTLHLDRLFAIRACLQAALGEIRTMKI